MMQSNTHNRQLYQHVLDLFQFWDVEKYRDRLLQIAETLEASESTILSSDNPTIAEQKAFALQLSRRAIDLHFEL